MLANKGKMWSYGQLYAPFPQSMSKKESWKSKENNPKPDHPHSF